MNEKVSVVSRWVWVGGLAGTYTGEDCENCERNRLERWQAPDGAIHDVCEKCRWDNTAHQYDSSMDEHDNYPTRRFIQ